MLKTHIKYMEFTHITEDSSSTSILSLSELRYGFEDYFTVRMVVPVKYQTQNFGVAQESFGLGDIIVDFKYNFYNPARELAYAGRIHPEISIAAGARLPTGDKKAELPPGDGSTDLELCGLIRVGNSVGAFYLSLGYWFNGLIGESDEQARMEDEFFYNLALEFPPLFNKLIFLTELDGFAGNEGKTHLAQICPGIQYRIQYTPGARLYSEVKQELLFECSLAIPFKAKEVSKYSFAPYAGLSWHF